MRANLSKLKCLNRLTAGYRRARLTDEVTANGADAHPRDQIERALIRSLVQREYSAIYSSTGGLLVILFVAYPMKIFPTITLIALVRLLSLVCSVSLARRIQKAMHKGRDITRDLSLLSLSSAAATFSWGAFLWPLDISYDNSMASFIIILAVILAVSLQSVTNAYHRPVLHAVLAGAILAITPKIYGIYDVTGIGLGLGALVLLMIVYAYARINEARARKMVVLQIKNRRISQRLQKANAKISEALAEAMWHAQRDPLTGLRNRRAFLDSLHETLDEGQPLNGSYLCLLDIDHFKTVNDTFGHNVGDRVLKAASKVLKGLEKQGQLLLTGRWGGEEFVILVSAANPLDAQTRLEVVRQQIGLIHETSEDWPEGLRVKASAGAAHLVEASEIDNALHAADAQLYDAKNRGRNCLRLAA